MPQTDFLVDHVQICAPEELREVPELQERIARRAKELCEVRIGRQGYDSHDWLLAECELLRPVEFSVTEYEDEVRVHAGVLGFEADELKVAIEPRRVILHGKKHLAPELGNHVFYVEWVPDEIYKRIELPALVVPEQAVCTLRGGALEVNIRKQM